MRTTLHMYGTHATELMLNHVADRAAMPQPVFEKIGLEMLAAERATFESGGVSEGYPWRPLNEDTIARKQRDRHGLTGHSKDPLIRTGDEMRSLSERHHPMNLFNVTRLFVLIGSTHHAVPFQRSGTKNMPAREPIRFGAFKRYRWEKMVADYILRGDL